MCEFLCNNLVNFCDFYYREKVQYEQPVKITETNEPQGVNKSFVQVSLLKWLLPSSKFY